MRAPDDRPGQSFELTPPSLRESFLEAVLAASADCIKVLDLDARLVFLSEGGHRALEVSDFNAIRGCPWPDFWRDETRTAAIEAVEAARAGGVGQFRARADTMAGNSRWWDVMVTPILGADGRPEKLLSVSRDITEMMEADLQRRDTEARARLLSEELQHRIKNTLAMVQAMVRQTLRTQPTLQAAQVAIEQRLAAMGRAHDSLTDGGLTHTDLHDVVHAAIDLHDPDGRLRVEGPDVRLPEQAALSLALMLHELTTNAVKYGALSVPSGSVHVAWTLAPELEAGPDARRLHLVWRERGGPPVTPPTRRGFGSRLIENSLASTLRGKAVISFLNEGVTCTVEGVLGASDG